MISSAQNINNDSNVNNTNASLLSNSRSLYQLKTNSNMNIPLPIKPRFIKAFNEVIMNCNQSILNFLTLQEISLLRGVNKLFLNIINDYYEVRLKLEINNITNFQNQNEEKTVLYMQNIDSQIPISNNQWLEFDLKKVTQDMELLDKNTIIQLKSIKKLNKFNENIYAPFCIIFGYKSSNYKVKAKGWKKTADLILNDPNIIQKIKQLDYENFSDNDILKAFLYLNSDELLLSKVRRYSLPFSKLIKWCQSVVSYHILIHPYTFRNKTSQIEIGSDIHKYVLFMDKIISKFYKFKRFLFKLGLVQIPLGDYVFNLQHNKSVPREKLDLSTIISVDMIANILTYLPLEKSYKFINVNQFGVNCFKQSLNINCYQIIKELILFKLNSYEKLFQTAPIVYENSIFGKYFLMLDDILNSTLDANQYGTNYVPFLSKDHLNEIRNLKTNNQLIITICKILCILFNLRVEKKVNQKGEIVPLYLNAVKLLAIKGVLPKLLRYFNKLELNRKQLQLLMNEIINLYGKNKLEEIKKLNKGIYQLLIWELCLFEYLKEFNPFMFINFEIFQKSLDNNPEEIQMLNYYLELINYLKYNLKFKYHFQTLVFSNMPEVPCYEFIPMITNLLQELNNEKINISPLLDNANPDKSKTANIYFDNKDFIPINAKPALYERIVEEIFSVNEKLYLNTVSIENMFNKNMCNITHSSDMKINLNTNLSESNNNLGIIREENAPASNIGDDRMLNKYLQNKSNIINNNINSNLNINNNNNINGINEFENGGEQNIIDNNINNNINQINSNSSNNNINISNIDMISSINYRTKYKNRNILKNNNSTNFNEIPNDIIIKNILLYLDIKSISPFSLVSKKCNLCYKINMFLRLLILDNHKQIFENENVEYIQSIDQKRNAFFADYELPLPNKDHALELISQLTNQDIIEIKNIYRKYNKHIEILIAPFVLFLGGKAKKKYNINGQKRMNYFDAAQKLLNDRKIYKKINEINLETIPANIFRETDKILKNEAFSLNKMKGYSPCLIHLIYWEMGILEFHRAVRYFCLNFYDMKILSKEEIVFCGQMDNISIMFNKLKYYNYTYCKDYEKDAINIMKELNSGTLEENEEIKEDKKEYEIDEERIVDYNYEEEEKNVPQNNIQEVNNDNNKNEENYNNIENMNENNIENIEIEDKMIKNNYGNNEINQLEDSIDFTKDKKNENNNLNDNEKYNFQQDNNIQNEKNKDIPNTNEEQNLNNVNDVNEDLNKEQVNEKENNNQNEYEDKDGIGQNEEIKEDNNNDNNNINNIGDENQINNFNIETNEEQIKSNKDSLNIPENNNANIIVNENENEIGNSYDEDIETKENNKKLNKIDNSFNENFPNKTDNEDDNNKENINNNE